MSPPGRYPDLYPVLNVLISTPVFVLAWLWSIKCGVEVGWALGGIGSGRRQVSPVEQRGSVDSTATVNGNGDASGLGSGYRHLGGRAVSLGYAQAKRKLENESRSRRGSTTFVPPAPGPA